MPEGKDFRDWAWCDTGGGAENPTRIYSEGDKRILAVTIEDDDPPRVLITMSDDDPPGVPIGADRSGPC